MTSELHIGHYILGRTIGTGAFAKVKEARHDQTGLRVAVKILNKRKMKNKNMIAKVKRQIKILKFINHHNIIKMYQVLDTTNDIFVIMQLAQGGQLYDYIQKYNISENEARFFFKQIISGVAHAHNNLIAHRDLKPQNILIDSNKLIKIVDFGLSNIMKNGKLLKTACGSPNYAAPQIVGQNRYEGTSVDIWSCGVILYALLVGHLPFYEETMSLLYRKIQRIYSIPQKVGPSAQDLIHRMLQVDPYNRIRINQIINHPWLRTHAPLYIKIAHFDIQPKEQIFQIDQTIFSIVKGMNFPYTQSVADQKLKKYIKKKDNNSFAIAYQLLRDQKCLKQNAKQILQTYTQQKPAGLILQDVPNETQQKIRARSPGSMQYGRRIKKPIKILAEIVLVAFQRLNIDFTVKNKQYSFRCVYNSKMKNNSSSNSTSSHISQMKQETIQKMIQEGNDQDQIQQQKVDKKIEGEQGGLFWQTKFMVQIYAADIKGLEHMIDIQLLQGHPMSLFGLINKLFNLIECLAQYH